MWLRRTLRECVGELEQLSNRFVRAYLNNERLSQAERDQELRSTSINGVEILRILALAIRSDQDAGLLNRTDDVIGAIKNNLSQEDIDNFPRSYRPPYDQLTGFSSLNLRDGLNKIAHTNGRVSRTAVDDNNHDLILSENYRNQRWLAIISIPALCRAIRSLPDRTV